MVEAERILFPCILSTYSGFSINLRSLPGPSYHYQQGYICSQHSQLRIQHSESQLRNQLIELFNYQSFHSMPNFSKITTLWYGPGVLSLCEAMPMNALMSRLRCVRRAMGGFYMSFQAINGLFDVMDHDIDIKHKVPHWPLVPLYNSSMQ